MIKPPSGASVKEAVVLMAGTGSRLRSGDLAPPKPLMPVLGRPLIGYTLAALARVGIEKVCAVVGYESDVVVAQTRPLVPHDMQIQFVANAEWLKQNGISVLAAAGKVKPPFLLTMSDHLYDDELLEILIRQAVPDEINLAVDRKIEAVFDLDDAMKVKTQGDRIVQIGKTLSDYDAIDTGVFVCADHIFHYLERAKSNGDCSLAQGIQLAAADNKARVVDIRQAWWQDVDTPDMLAEAERILRARGEILSSARS